MPKEETEEKACCSGHGEGCCGHYGGKIAMTVVLAFVLLAVGYLGGALTGTQKGVNLGNITMVTPVEHTISVSGESQRDVVPDLLVVSLSVETQEKAAADSQSANAAKTNAVVAALKALGIRGEEIQTTNYDLRAVVAGHWVCPSDNQNCKDDEKTYVTNITGYKTVHSLSVKSSEMDSGGRIIDAAINAGATKVQSIDFTLKAATRKTLEQELLLEAGQAAKVKAQKIADGVGATLGKVVSATSGYVYVPNSTNNRYLAEMAAPSAGGTSVSPGQLTVSASVSVGYGIG